MADKFDIVDSTTFKEVTKVVHGHTRETIVGNSKSGLFEPCVEIKPWNEDTLKIWKDTSLSTGVSSNVSDKSGLIWSDSDSQYTFSPFMKSIHSRFSDLANENGGAGINGAKFTIRLTSKPSIDGDGYARFVFKLSGHKDMEFWPQRSLEVEEDWAVSELGYSRKDAVAIMAGTQRPEYVVDSLAIYHKTKGGFNQYSTGKVCHIYRAWCEDSLGNFTWGKWEIDEIAGTLTKCIPEEAFDFIGATWWVVDGTIGNENSGVTTQPSENQVRGPYNLGDGYDPGETTTVDSIEAYLSVDSGSENILGGIWDINDSLALETNGATGAVSISDGAAWKTLIYSSKPTVTNGTDYIFGVIGEGTVLNTYYDSLPAFNAGFQDYRVDNTIPDPVVITVSWARCSVYCFWEEGGPSPFFSKIFSVSICES